MWDKNNQILFIRGLLKKYREFWISAGYVYSIFWWRCVGTHPSLMLTSSAILNVQLIFDSYFVWTCFDSSSIFISSVSGTRKSRSHIWGIWWLRQHYCVVFGQKFAHKQRCVSRALSWCKSQFLFFHKSGRLWRIASCKLRINCR